MKKWKLKIDIQSIFGIEFFPQTHIFQTLYLQSDGVNLWYLKIR